MYSCILKGETDWTCQAFIEDPNLVSLLQGLLQVDPSQRLRDPVQIKAHPYFADIDWEAVLRKELAPPYIPWPGPGPDPLQPSSLLHEEENTFEGFTWTG